MLLSILSYIAVYFLVVLLSLLCCAAVYPALCCWLCYVVLLPVRSCVAVHPCLCCWLALSLLLVCPGGGHHCPCLWGAEAPSRGCCAGCTGGPRSPILQRLHLRRLVSIDAELHTLVCQATQDVSLAASRGGIILCVCPSCCFVWVASLGA